MQPLLLQCGIRRCSIAAFRRSFRFRSAKGAFRFRPSGVPEGFYYKDTTPRKCVQEKMPP